jgi:hypothetical protein
MFGSDGAEHSLALPISNLFNTGRGCQQLLGLVLGRFITWIFLLIILSGSFKGIARAQHRLAHSGLRIVFLFHITHRLGRGGSDDITLRVVRLSWGKVRTSISISMAHRDQTRNLGVNYWTLALGALTSLFLRAAGDSAIPARSAAGSGLSVQAGQVVNRLIVGVPLLQIIAS